MLVCTIGLLPAPLFAHPIHSTLSEFTCGANGAFTLRIRTFADDFGRAVAPYRRVAPALGGAGGSPESRYLADVVRVNDASGGRVSMVLSSQAQQGEVMWLELKGRMTGPLSGAWLLNTMQFSLYRDQVNIVKVECGATRWSTLFSRGSEARQIP